MKSLLLIFGFALLSASSFANTPIRTIDGQKGSDILQGLMEVGVDVTDCQNEVCTYTLLDVDCSYDYDATPTGGRSLNIYGTKINGDRIEAHELPDDSQQICQRENNGELDCHYGELDLFKIMIEENLLKDGASNSNRVLWGEFKKIQCTYESYYSASCTFEYK